MIDPQVWNPVPHEHVLPAISLPQNKQYGAYGGQAKVRPDNEVLILFLIDRAGRIEVVDTTSKSIVLALPFTLNLLRMNIMTGSIIDEIQWPPYKLLSDERQSSHDWRLFCKLGHFMSEAAQLCGISFACRRYKDLITLHVTGRFVMFAMADLPGEIWDKEQAVTEEANGIVQCL